MSGLRLIDFYHGWLIEVVGTEAGFSSVCRSPSGEKHEQLAPHSNQQEALFAAKHAINWRLTCQTLTHLLREFYEANCLSFEDWQSLQQSLASGTFSESK